MDARGCVIFFLGWWGWEGVFTAKALRARRGAKKRRKSGRKIHRRDAEGAEKAQRGVLVVDGCRWRGGFQWNTEARRTRRRHGEDADKTGARGFVGEGCLLLVGS